MLWFDNRILNTLAYSYRYHRRKTAARKAAAEKKL